MDIDRFVAERDSALRSLDRLKIAYYCRKYNIQMPIEETVFWLAVHKARLQINSLTDDEKAISRQWIKDHGFKEEIG